MAVNSCAPCNCPRGSMDEGTYRQGVHVILCDLLTAISGSDGAIVSGAVTTETPTINTATSTTILAADATRKYLLIQNTSSGNIVISLTGAVLTGIVPSATNIGHLILPFGTYENNGPFCPTGAITCYQTSGGTINSVVVTHG